MYHNSLKISNIYKQLQIKNVEHFSEIWKLWNISPLLCEPELCKEVSLPMFMALWCKAESEFARRQLVSGGGDKYAPLLYGEVSIRFSFGLDLIGPTPTLRTTRSR
jgi:hypothetical protein